MLILRIKQAQSALKAGRLDEAYQLLGDPEVRSHRHGQSLVTGLVAALAERAKDHLACGRVEAASADCQKAALLGGNQGQVAELQAAIVENVTDNRDKRKNVGRARSAVRKHIENAQLTRAEALVGSTGSQNAISDSYRRQVTAQREDLEAALAELEAALDREDWSSAIQLATQALKIHASDVRLLEQIKNMSEQLHQLVRNAIDQGRLDRAQSLMKHVKSIAGGHQTTHELVQLIQQLQDAWSYLEQGRFAEAQQATQRAGAMVGQLSWLKSVQSQLEQLSQASAALNGGPLGFLANGVLDETKLSLQQSVPERHAELRPQLRRGASSTALPNRFLLQVDGVGSYLVYTQPIVTVGPISASARADLPLITAPDTPVVQIERVDDDYFIRSPKTIEINTRQLSSRLLVDGDRLALSRRCRIKFRLPNPASTSALLELSGAQLTRSDVRRVILMDRAIVLGPGSTAHIRGVALAGDIVLHLRDGYLLCQSSQKLAIDGREIDANTPIPLDTQIQAGPVSFQVTSSE